MKWSFIVAVALAIVGCVRVPATPSPACPPPRPAGPYTFYPPTGFTADEEAQIRQAADAWNAVTRPTHKLAFSEFGHQRVLRFAPDWPAFDGQWPGNGVMFIRPGRTDILRIAIHEFGHALGMSHIPHPGAVMCSFDQGVDCGPTGSSTITADDLTECRRVGACP